MGRQLQYSKLFAEITPGTPTLLLISTLMLLTNGMSLLSPWIAGMFTESLIGQPTPGRLSYNQILLFWLVLLLLQAFLSFFSRYYSGKTSENMLAGLRNKLYSHLQSLPMGYYHEHKQGKILALLANDAVIISNFVSQTLVSLIPHLITAFGALVCIAYISPIVALLVSLLVPLFYITTKLLGRRIGPVSREMIQVYGDTFAIAEENLANLPIIKSCTRESHEEERFTASNSRLLALTTEYFRVQAMLSPAIKFLATAIVLFTLWVISDKILAGTITTSEIVRLLLYGLLLTQPVSSLANVYGQIQRTLGAADQILEVLAITGENSVDGKNITSLKGSIHFEGVTFKYPGRENILNDFHLTVSAGETLAITGKNGAGKTTLAHLLIRFMDPAEGVISIDGHNIQELHLSSLRRQIGLVQQQVLLQNSSIEENISFGLPGADQSDIVHAAKKAHAYDFIQALPSGFQTVIGDRGVKLSGGQKQRLSLARALLIDPAILIFDEATAMFDPEGEKNFIEECREFLRSKTVLLITHRPGSLILADRIVKLENGKAVISG